MANTGLGYGVSGGSAQVLEGTGRGEEAGGSPVLVEGKQTFQRLSQR